MQTFECYYYADTMYFLLLLAQFLPVYINVRNRKMREYCISIIYLIFVWKTSLYTSHNIIQSIQKTKLHIFIMFFFVEYISIK